jgi:hypothetical protein
MADSLPQTLRSIRKKPTRKQNDKLYELGDFNSIPKDVIRCGNYYLLTGNACKLLSQVWEQYNGFNNGDLSATYSVMQQKGWVSSATLFKARDCLLHYGFITKSRMGGRNQCTLYALTWERIDECDGKIEVSATSHPSRKFTKKVEKWSPQN